MDSLLRSTLCQWVAYAAPTGLSSEQVPTFGPVVRMRARVEPRDNVTFGPGGRLVTPGTSIITEAVIPKDSRLWLPPNADGTTPTGTPVMVTASTPRVDDKGNTHHWETEV